ncbi:MAG: preprotein translocase subunit SecY [Saprospiraceae bacterium]|jgi:preprotein translocase subunit SecY|nr:preprotein translocase subunit SecY [Saprospiraceae bacterium]
MKLISVFKNIWSIKELRDRILYTLALLLVYRVGTFVVLPGVIPAALEKASADRGANDLLGLINVFTGGAFDNAAVLALSVMPYITASIIVQLLGFAVPYFQRLQTREGESGRKRLNQITRLLTVAISMVQGGGYLQLLSGMNAVSPNIPEGLFWFSNIIILTAGTIFCMWLGERITDKGIGNGISMIIMIGIIARLPQSFVFEFQKLFGDSQLLLFVVELAFLFVVVLATVLVIQGVRRIPIQFAKRMVGRTGGSLPQSSARDYLPLKVNSAGVMPIIFAQALMFLPATAMQYIGGEEGAAAGGRIHMFNDIYSLGYNLVFFLLIVIFTYVYTALMINPTNYAEYLKRSNAFIPGVKPGEATASYIENVMTLITLPGSIFLGLIGILPSIAATLGVNQQFALFFGGTTLLIMVGVALDTLQVIESYLLTKKYDGLIKSGRIQGRSTQGLQIGQPQ